MHLAPLLEARELSLAELSAQVGVTVQRLEALRDGASATLRELTRIADALAVDEQALLSPGGDGVDAAWTAGRLRAGPGSATLTAADVRRLARLRQLIGHATQLAEQLNEWPPLALRARTVASLPSGEQPHAHGYALAEAARATFGIGGDDPISNLTRWLENVGIVVVDVALDDCQIEAISFVEPKLLPAIVVNRRCTKTQSAHLRRAVLAHELCHVLHDSGQDARLFRASRDDLNDAIEQRAQAFGAEFLAPKAAILELAPGAGDVTLVERIAMTYGVSVDSAYWRAHVAGRVPDDKRLRARILRLLTKIDPSGEFAADAPPAEATLAQGYLATLIDRAEAELLISGPRANELRSWS